MKTEELTDLGLTEEQIKSIFALNGSDIEKHKQDLVQRETALLGIKTQLVNANSKIKEFEEMDVDLIKQQAKDWEKKYQEDTKALTAQIQEKDYRHTAESFLSNYTFTSNLAKEAVFSKLSEKKLPLENGKFLGGEDFINSLKEQNPGAFQQETKPLPKIVTKANNPVGGIEMTREQFKKMSYLEKLKIKNEQPDTYKTLVE